MICDMCNKKKAKTFRRAGGHITLAEARERKLPIGKDKDILAHSSVCLACIKTRTAKGGFIEGNIITNPTIMPSGDQFEWVINEE